MTTNGVPELSLQIFFFFPRLFSILKSNWLASLCSPTWLRFSFPCSLVNGLIFVLCCFSPGGAQVKNAWCKAATKEAEQCADVLQKTCYTGVRSVYTGVSDHVQECVWLWRCMDAQYTHCLFWFYGLAHTLASTHARTISEEFPFSFSIWFPTHTKFHADMFQFTRTHPNAHMPTPLPAMYLSGLPCCLSNQRMGSFQLHWSEHIIPFPSSPLLNTQIHATRTYWNTHHHPTHSPGGTMLPTVNPKDWCVSLDKMRLCVITRHYTTEPPSNSISQDVTANTVYTQAHTHNRFSSRLRADLFFCYLCPFISKWS